MFSRKFRNSAEKIKIPLKIQKFGGTLKFPAERIDRSLELRGQRVMQQLTTTGRRSLLALVFDLGLQSESYA
jgi:hypothetical protein